MFKLTGPTDPKGPTGPTGPTGSTGPTNLIQLNLLNNQNNIQIILKKYKINYCTNLIGYFKYLFGLTIYYYIGHLYILDEIISNEDLLNELSQFTKIIFIDPLHLKNIKNNYFKELKIVTSYKYYAISIYNNN